MLEEDPFQFQRSSYHLNGMLIDLHNITWLLPGDDLFAGKFLLV
jgi:hypothetical protein